MSKLAYIFGKSIVDALVPSENRQGTFGNSRFNQRGEISKLLVKDEVLPESIEIKRLPKRSPNECLTRTIIKKQRGKFYIKYVGERDEECEIGPDKYIFVKKTKV